MLLLGDSITSGGAGTYGYRYPLFYDLLADGATFDFVGSLSSGPAGDLVFDRDHEGHASWSILDLTQGQTQNDHDNGRYAAQWVVDTTPDYILFMAGHNDPWLSEADYETRYDNLLSSIFAVDSDVKLVISTVTPSYEAVTGKHDAQARMNQAVVNAANQFGMIHNVTLVDSWTGFDQDTMLGDNYHPNDLGNAYIASKFEDGLMEAVPEPSMMVAGGLLLAAMRKRKSR